jgi:deoxyribose-phosphate aldolase
MGDKSVETQALTRQELEKLVETIAMEVMRRLGPSAWVSEEYDNCSASAAHSCGAVCMNDQPPEVRALAGLMDHTLLRPQATRSEMERLADEAREWCFAAVCVNPSWVAPVAERLRGSGVKVAAVAGFPLGATLTSAKRAEAEAAILAGADEVDMVMNVGAMKSGDLARVESDIQGVLETCRAGGAALKVILENAYLAEEEKVAACQIARRVGAEFVKTSTGFGPWGAKEEDVRLMRRTVGPAMGVKAAGGIRTLDDALRMLQAGATRLGTSSSVAIVQQARQSLQPVN